MQVYRLCKDNYSSLDGIGASKTGGTWNSKGKQIIYTSGSIALAALEVFVHLDYDLLPDDFMALTINIPDNSKIEQYPETILTRGETITFGDEWIKSRRSLILAVPSYVIREEKNYLINPEHPDFKKVELASKKPFKFDDRLFKF